MVRKSLAVIVLGTGMLAPACSDEPTAPRRNNQQDDPCEDGSRDLHLSKNLALQGSTPTYEGEIADFVENTCYGSGCHSSDGTQSDLTTYENVATRANSMLGWMKEENGKPMPPGGPPPEDDIERFEAWIEAGRPLDADDLESDSSTDGTGEDDEPSASGSQPSESSDDECDPPERGFDQSTETRTDESEDEGVPEGRPEVLDKFVNPAKLKECHDRGKVFDRRDQSCHEYGLADFTCERENVREHYSEFSSVQDMMETGELKDYSVDQCGVTESGTLAVFFMCIQKDGNPECIPEDQVGDTGEIEVAVKILKPSS